MRSANSLGRNDDSEKRYSSVAAQILCRGITKPSHADIGVAWFSLSNPAGILGYLLPSSSLLNIFRVVFAFFLHIFRVVFFACTFFKGVFDLFYTFFKGVLDLFCTFFNVFVWW